MWVKRRAACVDVGQATVGQETVSQATEGQVAMSQATEGQATVDSVAVRQAAVQHAQDPMQRILSCELYGPRVLFKRC